jgi:Baseplate J-like protein
MSESSNTISNFYGISPTEPDILPPKLAKSIGNIIKGLKAAYNPVEIDATIAALVAHVSNHENPHQVSSAQVPVDGPYLLASLYAQYLESVTYSPVLTLDQFINKLMTLLVTATSLTDSSQAALAITAVLMNSLYMTHNQSTTAHPYIQGLFTPDVSLPLATYCLDPRIGSPDLFSYNNNTLQFLSSADAILGGFVNALSFAIGTIFILPTSIGMSYADFTSIASSLPNQNGTICVKAYINPNTSPSLNIISLTNALTPDSLTVSIPMLELTPGGFASGNIAIEAESGVDIPSGTIFTTTNESNLMFFTSTEDVSFPSTETLNVPVMANVVGSSSNISEGSEFLTVTFLDGIVSLVAESDFSGGLDQEPITLQTSVYANLIYQDIKYPQITIPTINGWVYLGITYALNSITFTWYTGSGYASQNFSFDNLCFTYNRLSSNLPLEISDSNYCLTQFSIFPSILTTNQLSVVFGLN